MIVAHAQQMLIRPIYRIIDGPADKHAKQCAPPKPIASDSGFSSTPFFMVTEIYKTSKLRDSSFINSWSFSSAQFFMVVKIDETSKIQCCY